jgi:hypothetical protein
LAKAVFAREFFAGLHTQAATTTAICRASTTSVERAPRAACGRQRSELSMGPIMWTLIIITLLLPNNAGSTGASGAGVTTTMLSFADQQKCLAAAEAIGVPAGAVAPVSGIYRIVTRCVARDRGALLRPGDGIFRPDGSMGR